MSKSKSTRDIRAELTERAIRQVISGHDLLSSGSTQLDLACSGRLAGAYAKGKYVLLAGQSEAAKTWMGMTALAQATIRGPDFANHRLVYDPVEDGASMDKTYFFGEKLAEKIEPLHKDLEASETVEDMYDGIDRLFKEDEPFILVVDSETALDTRDDQKKRGKQRAARQKGKKEAGTFGTSKAKIHSTHLRGVRNRLKRPGSLLILISQLRENINFGSQFEPHTRPGGLALRYYADLEIWTYLKGHIKTKYRDKMRHQGVEVLAKIKKNRLTGKKASARLRIYHDHGIDDVGANVWYLLDEGHWKKNKGIIRAKELSVSKREEDLIRYIEENNKERIVQKAVRSVWKEIEEAVAVHRKNPYA